MGWGGGGGFLRTFLLGFCFEGRDGGRKAGKDERENRRKSSGRTNESRERRGGKY